MYMDNNNTKEELMAEIVCLNKRIAALEKLTISNGKAEEVMMRLSAVVRNSNDAITVQKLNGTILDWNHGAEVIYGWSSNEVIDKNITLIIPEDKRPEKDDMRDRLIKGEKVISFETNRITKDGRILDIWLTLGGLMDKDGELNAISTIERDITGRKNAEKALRESEAKLREQKYVLEQKNATLRELLEQIEIEKKIIKDQIYANVENLLLPIFKKIKGSKSANKKYLELLENNLKELTSSFGLKITDSHLRLSPREVEICNMIKQGFTSKEISETLNIAYKTVERHRNNIRRKLGIVKKSMNLVTFLQNKAYL